ncbi:MAG: DUF6036 family nucleotidyltransferase [Variovorax sp.]|nr:DUF6036 family nucleotidyltransferase [Variovorax sp.]
MKLSQLLHVLRAAAEISGEKSFVIVGSQAVLLLQQELDERLTMSDEVDLYPGNAPDKSDKIDGAIGALSQFHDEFGYHADGVGPETAVMPSDWIDRATLHYFGELTAVCPELHDLCVSKSVAMREKDAEFVRLLLRDGHIGIEMLVQRIEQLDPQVHPVSTIVAWARRRQLEAQNPAIP